MDKRYITWDYIDIAADYLAEKITESQLLIEAIYGVPRGGLIIASLLSHRLNIPLTMSRVSSIHENENILIVDDICDSGKTLEKYKIFRYPIITIHHKKSARVKPIFYYEVAEETDWIVYPWEKEDSEPIVDYLKN
jgi:hypoxanthine phosphoribosyltransferase